MATVTISAAAYKDRSAASRITGTLGEANTAAHKPVYLKASDNKWYLGNANSTTETAGESGIGLTMQKGQIDEDVDICLDAELIVEATLTKGHTYVLGATAAGDINEDADADTNNWYKTVLFVARDTSATNVEIVFRPIVSNETA